MVDVGCHDSELQEEEEEEGQRFVDEVPVHEHVSAHALGLVEGLHAAVAYAGRAQHHHACRETRPEVTGCYPFHVLLLNSDVLINQTGALFTEQDGDDGKEGAAQGVHHPEGGALEQRRVEGKESVTPPHQEREEDSCSRRRQGNLEFVAAQILTQIWNE